MLPQIAQGESNKMWIIPSEFTQALGQLTQNVLGKPEEGQPAPATTTERAPARA